MKLIKDKKIYFLAFLVPIIMYCLILLAKGIYPFGDIANLANDENLQYEQFFTYYYNVLHSMADISYSFDKSLGGSLVSLWGYYLASPLNLILLFFDKLDILNFVFFITAIKIGLCGLTFSIFIKNLFKNLKPFSVIMLSIAYCFTQYVVGQMSNIMWLDGVYMLPLILYFIDKFLESGKKVGLYITFICTIIFNWYTGYMNCLFAVLYFIYRLICIEYEKNNKLQIKPMLKKGFQFLSIEFLSVLASMVVFLPIILAQLGGRSGISSEIFEFATNGSLLNIFRGFMIGSPNPSEEITLFCSTLMLIFIIYYIFDKRIKPFEKKATIVFASIMIASLFFVSLEYVWVGFMREGSFVYRFLYLVILTILLLAASVVNQKGSLDKKLLGKIIAGIILMFLIFDLLNPYSPKRLWAQIIILGVYFVVLIKFKEGLRKKVCLIAVFGMEILLNAYLVIGDVYNVDKDYYQKYTTDESLMIEQIRPENNEFYRVETNIDRDEKEGSFISNESLAHSYSTIEHYSSSYDSITGLFLANLGYCRNEFPTFYHEPILAADSLLGVKYLLTNKDYDGFELQSNYDSYNGKKVYENQYVLPLGFNTSEKITKVSSNGNPFEYINDIYSGIIREEVTLFTPYQMTVQDDDTLKFSSEIDNDLHIIYMQAGYNPRDLLMSRNGAEGETYSTGWLNHNVLVLGDTSQTHTLEVSNYTEEELKIDFYSFDLQEFERVIDKIRSNVIELQSINDGYIKFTASGDNVLLSIPYDTAWEVTVNGKKVTPEKAADALMMIPIDGSDNEVILTYHVKGKKAGIILTIFSLIIFSLWLMYDKLKQKHKKVV